MLADMPVASAMDDKNPEPSAVFVAPTLNTILSFSAATLFPVIQLENSVASDVSPASF